MKITFLGAAGTVTGSKFLVEAGRTRLLLDCGLFQGIKSLRRRNWNPLPFEPSSLDAVVLTHAHIDHTGYLPILVREGFSGPIHCTAPTRSLGRIMLPDSGRIQEEDAAYANRKGFSKHAPAKPLYTESDAYRVLPLVKKAEPQKTLEIGDVAVDFFLAGHILGAASVRVRADGGPSVLFSGDLGRSADPLMPAPVPPAEADYVVMESTYGDRRHPPESPVDAMEPIVKRALDREGILLIPSFAVGRAQTILYCLGRLFEERGIPRVPVYLDSPMATDVTELYERYADYHRLDADEVADMCVGVAFVHTRDESKELNGHRGPAVIVSASGMLTGGRVLHHIKAHAGRPTTTILLPGYQAPGTRGARLAAGADSIKIHGGYVDVKADVQKVDVFSAHADQAELLAWIGAAARPPERVFLVHGEPEAADELRRRIEEQTGWQVQIPEHRETITLT